MSTNPNNTYEEWLTTIASTRLLFNTMAELENWLDNHSLHNNGVKRSFKSVQRMRAAFRDLKEQVRLDTDEAEDLELLLGEYQTAWRFYEEHLLRRANPEELAFQLLQFCHAPAPPTNLNPRIAQTFLQVQTERISTPFLIAFLLKAIPGYGSRDGDATDMPQKYEAVMQLLERVTSNTPTFTLLPALAKAKQEQNKTRLMLIYHTREVLEIYNGLTHPQGIYDTVDYVKQQTMALDLDGFWNECEGRNEHTHFWQFVEADNNTGHFMYHWEKLADGTMRHTRFLVRFLCGEQGKPVANIMHPLAFWQHIQGHPYSDAVNTYYLVEKSKGKRPLKLNLLREFPCQEWPAKINLTRVTDEALNEQYANWIAHSKEITALYPSAEYLFHPSLFAVSINNIYILSVIDDFLYRIPRDAHDGFERIKMGDNVGVLLMDNKAYLAFDELDIYLPIEPETLEKYGITQVANWEVTPI